MMKGLDLDRTVVVILAGGGGTRLWPLSTDLHPKQLCSFSRDGRTMIQKTFERIRTLVPEERIYIATGKDLAEKIKQQLPSVSSSNIIMEPARKDTALAIGFSALLLEEKYPDATMVVLTADHEIEEVDKFLSSIKKAIKAAQNGPYLVTIGIKPSEPSTEYGYIKTDASIAQDTDIFKGIEFKEKPDRKTAEEFLQADTYFWNSGMFIWKINNILKAIQRYMPQLHTGLQKIKNSLHASQRDGVVKEVFEQLEKISIDHGLMQKVKIGDEVKILVVKGDFTWADLGNWKAIQKWFLGR